MAKYISEYDADRENGRPLEEQYTLDEIMLEFSPEETAPAEPETPEAPEYVPPQPLEGQETLPLFGQDEDVHQMDAARPDKSRPESNSQAETEEIPAEPEEEPAEEPERPAREKRGFLGRRRGRKGPQPEPEEEPEPEKEEKAPEEKPSDDEESPTIAMSPIRVQEEQPQDDGGGPTPQKAMKRYAKRLPGLRIRVFAATIVCLAMGYLTVAGEYGVFLPGILMDSGPARAWILLVLQVICGVIALDMLIKGVRDLIRFRIYLNTLALIAYLSSLAHGVLYLTGGSQWGFPMGAVACWGLLFLLGGELSRCKGRQLACKAAAGAEKPAFIVKSAGIWQEPALIKTSGDGREFVAQLERRDGAQKAWGLLSPILVIASVVLSVLICVAEGGFGSIFRHLSAMSGAALSLGAALCFVSPFKKLSRRLAGRAAALAGWRGVKLVNGRNAVVIGDEDVFPPGSATLNGMKVVGGSSADRVLSYTASVVAASGSGLGRSFTELLHSQGIPFSQVNDLSFDEDGVSARIANNIVYVGSREYMTARGVSFNEDVKLDNAVYTAINNEPAGIFAVRYGSAKASGEAMDMVLSDKRLHPVLAVRNFHLDNEYLAKRLGVPASAMEYPRLSDRLGLSESSPVEGEPAAALCRQGLLPFAETVIGGRRLRRAVKWNVMFSAAGSVIGMLIMFYLAMIGEFSAGSAANLLIYSILWLVPTVLISGWVNRY